MVKLLVSVTFTSPQMYHINMEDHLKATIERNLKDFYGQYRVPQGAVVLDVARPILPDEIEMHELSLADLRYLPRYLIEALICGDAAQIFIDHSQYWGWTASFILIAREIGVDFSSFSAFSQSEMQYHLADAVSLRRTSIIHAQEHSHLNNHLLQNTMRGAEYVKNHPANNFHRFFPSRQVVFNILSLYLFPLAEGLVRRRCSDVVSIDGELIDEEFSSYANRGRVYFRDALRLWQAESANSVTSEALKFIDDTNQSLPGIPSKQDSLKEMYAPTSQSYDPGSLFDILRVQRNTHAHGEHTSGLIAPVLLSLCCMMYWDDLPDDEFDEIRSSVIDWIKARDRRSMASTRQRELYQNYIDNGEG